MRKIKSQNTETTETNDLLWKNNFCFVLNVSWFLDLELLHIQDKITKFSSVVHPVLYKRTSLSNFCDDLHNFDISDEHKNWWSASYLNVMIRNTSTIYVRLWSKLFAHWLSVYIRFDYVHASNGWKISIVHDAVTNFYMSSSPRMQQILSFEKKAVTIIGVLLMIFKLRVRIVELRSIRF